MVDKTHAPGGFALPDWKAFLAWWLGGLRQCLPRRLRQGLGQTRRYVLLAHDGGFVLQLHGTESVEDLAQLDSLQNPALARLLGNGRKRQASLTLRVPAERVFKRTVALPIAATGNLRQVLQFEMDRLTPFADAEVLFDFRVLGRQADKGQVQVELAVLRRELVETLLAELEVAGQSARIVDATGLWEGANLLRSALPRGGSTHAGAWLAVGLIIALAAAALLTPLWQARQVVLDLDARLQQARDQAAVIAGLQRQLDEGAALANFVSRRQQQRVPIVELLSELTELLPDDTWLQQLSIRGKNVELQGESAQATTLIELLEDSPRFESVAFRAPLTQVRGAATERFSIVMTLTDREQP
jgi:general secretion pathway protein L